MNVMFIVGGSASIAYHSLAAEFSAIEPSPWALLLASSVRSWGHDSSIIDLDAISLTRPELSSVVETSMPDLIVFVVYGQNPNAGTLR